MFGRRMLRSKLATAQISYRNTGKWIEETVFKKTLRRFWVEPPTKNGQRGRVSPSQRRNKTVPLPVTDVFYDVGKSIGGTFRAAATELSLTDQRYFVLCFL